MRLDSIDELKFHVFYVSAGKLKKFEVRGRQCVFPKAHHSGRLRQSRKAPENRLAAEVAEMIMSAVKKYCVA